MAAGERGCLWAEQLSGQRTDRAPLAEHDERCQRLCARLDRRRETGGKARPVVPGHRGSDRPENSHAERGPELARRIEHP